MYRDGKGIAPDAAKAQFWVAQAQRSQDLASWQRWNTKNGIGMSMMDIMGAIGDMWEEAVSRQMSDEDLARMHLNDMQRRATINRMNH
jgi:hypothetical protein